MFLTPGTVAPITFRTVVESSEQIWSPGLAGPDNLLERGENGLVAARATTGTYLDLHYDNALSGADCPVNL